MKKLISIFAVCLCAGCAMGINQSVATINGKQYLVEKETFCLPILPVAQWSGDPKFTDLSKLNPDNSIAKNILKEVTQSCKDQQPSSRYVSEDMYDCILEKLEKLSQ